MNKTMKFVLVKNALPTAKEPYNGLFVSNGTVGLEELTERICRGRTNVDAPTARLVLRTALGFVAEDMRENLFRYATGLLTFEPAIGGSLPSMDAPLTDANPVYVAVRLSQDLVREIGATVPARDANDTVAVRIDDVLDLSADKVKQLTGTEAFQLTGRNISALLEDEALEIVDSHGASHAVRVTGGDGMGQRVVAAAVTAPAPGKATIELKTHGYATPDGELLHVSKPVTVVAGKASADASAQDAPSARPTPPATASDN